MTRSELVERLSLKNSTLYPSDIDRVVTTVLNTIKSSLLDGKRVELRGFGVFGVKQRMPRQARNPKTGESVLVPEKTTPYFKAGKVLTKRLNPSL